jgi:hypothetical protein
MKTILVLTAACLVATWGAPTAKAGEIYDTTPKDPYVPNGYIATAMFCETPEDVIAFYDKIAASPNPEATKAALTKALIYRSGAMGPCEYATIRHFKGAAVASKWYESWDTPRFLGGPRTPAGFNVWEIFPYGYKAMGQWHNWPKRGVVIYSASKFIDKRAMQIPE